MHLVYWKFIIRGKSDLPITNLVCEKVLFTINGPSKMLFHFIAFFFFPKFEWLLLKPLRKKHPFYNEFWGFWWILLCHKYFWPIYFWQWNNNPFEHFWNFLGNTFCFFNFLKWKKYYNLNFDDTFKLRFVHVLDYGNLRSSFINKPYLRTAEHGIVFFSQFLFMFILTRFLSKTLWENIIFNINFPDSFQDVVCILQNIRMSNFAILKWWSFEYKGNSENFIYFRYSYFWHIF